MLSVRAVLGIGFLVTSRAAAVLSHSGKCPLSAATNHQQKDCYSSRPASTMAQSIKYLGYNFYRKLSKQNRLLACRLTCGWSTGRRRLSTLMRSYSVIMASVWTSWWSWRASVVQQPSQGWGLLNWSEDDFLTCMVHSLMSVWRQVVWGRHSAVSDLIEPEHLRTWQISQISSNVNNSILLTVIGLLQCICT